MCVHFSRAYLHSHRTIRTRILLTSNKVYNIIVYNFFFIFDTSLDRILRFIEFARIVRFQNTRIRKSIYNNATNVPKMTCVLLLLYKGRKNNNRRFYR